MAKFNAKVDRKRRHLSKFWKIIVVLAAAIVLTLAGYKAWQIFDNSRILYKTVSCGGIGGGCTSLKIYSKGKFVEKPDSLRTVRDEIRWDQLEKIQNIIKNSGIFDKKCENSSVEGDITTADIVLDGATYQNTLVHYEGKYREFSDESTTCNDGLIKIDNVVNEIMYPAE